MQIGNPVYNRINEQVILTRNQPMSSLKVTTKSLPFIIKYLQP
ncbi:hypothetical protein HanPSC8_Chr10g0432061 [Helianthus annuus]|nr:hypothetical protein HanPSC8_Chr10g0432061 [Helianthus annuus]